MNKNLEAGVPRLYVCENRGEWAAALRRCLSDHNLRVYELRSATSARAELRERPSSAIIWEAREDGILGLIETLQLQQRQFPASISLAVGDRKLACYEWLLREAGVAHVVFGMRGLSQMVRLAERHFARLPAPPVSWPYQIERQLPWPAFRSAEFQLEENGENPGR